MQRRVILPLLLVLLLFLLLTVFLNAVASFIHTDVVVVEKPIVLGEQDATMTSMVANFSAQRKLYPVLHVVDGDTLDIAMGGVKTKLRLIGINTPEVVDPQRKVECFGKEASMKAKALLMGSEVSIELDPSQDKYDKYGRLLAYVYLPNGTSFNKRMIEEGYAYEYTYRLPYKYQREFKQAQYDAKRAGRGLWADGVCIKD